MKRLMILVIIANLFIPQVVLARGWMITASNDNVVISFPNSISFGVDLESDAEISTIQLLYGTTQDTCGNVIAIALPEFTPGKKVHATWDWDMRQSGGEPPGATIWWQWEIKDSAGNNLLTGKKTITWLDTTHPWKDLSQGMIRLHYYTGDTSFGNTLLDAAVSALDRLSSDTGIKPNHPIDLYIYADQQDMKDAVLYEPGWTGGLAYPEYNSVIIGIAPADVEWGKRTEAHELTHVLVGNFTFTCLGSMPTWLVEGLAVYGEGGPETSGVSYFEQNKTDNTLLSFRVLSGGFSEDPNKADLSYSQSYYMVNYLIEKYGKDKLISFLKLLQNGGDLSDSLSSTYGFDLSGFEKEWRASLSLPALVENITEATATPTIIPTIIPIQGIQPAATITSWPISPTHSVDMTPQPTASAGIQQFLNGNNVRTILMIVLGCTCLGGIVLVAGFTILFVSRSRTAKKKGDLQ
jgi:hypothetical protein